MKQALPIELPSTLMHHPCSKLPIANQLITFRKADQLIIQIVISAAHPLFSIAVAKWLIIFIGPTVTITVCQPGLLHFQA